MVISIIKNRLALISLYSNDHSYYQCVCQPFQNISASTININMLARFLSNTLNYCYFATVIGGKVNAEMPQVQFPTKPKPRVQ
jgi:hypothetical protein